MNDVNAAAKFYLQHQGKKGTEKQIEDFKKTTLHSAIIRMATQRGFKPKNIWSEFANKLNESHNCKELKGGFFFTPKK